MKTQVYPLSSTYQENSSGTRHHLSSATNKKQLFVTSKAGGCIGLELKLADGDAEGPVFCKEPSQSPLIIRSAPDLQFEVKYDCLLGGGFMI